MNLISDKIKCTRSNHQESEKLDIISLREATCHTYQQQRAKHEYSFGSNDNKNPALH